MEATLVILTPTILYSQVPPVYWCTEFLSLSYSQFLTVRFVIECDDFDAE